MRHELAQYAVATVDRRWLAQLRELDDGPTPPRSSTWIDARRAGGTDWFTLVSQSVTVLHLLARLPSLEHLTSLPGEAVPAPPDPRDAASAAPAADERILSRVRMLLAKAESTTFEAEAATFTAGAQALMARHSIDAALLARQAGDRPGPDGPQGRRIGIDNPYEGPKAVLLQVVASANRCRMVWSRELGFGTVVGFEADLDCGRAALHLPARPGDPHARVRGLAQHRSWRQPHPLLPAVVPRRLRRPHRRAAARGHGPGGRGGRRRTHERTRAGAASCRSSGGGRRDAEHLVPRRASGQGRRGTRRRGLALRSVGRGPGPAGLGPQAAGLSGWPPLHDAPSPTPAGASDCRRVSASAS